MTAIVRHLRSLFATNEDSFVIFMFIVVCRSVSRWGSVPSRRWDERRCAAKPRREETPTDSSPYFSDVWAVARWSRR